MWPLYRALYAGTLLVAGPWMLLRRGRHYLPTLRHRLGWTEPVENPGALWLHAVSVGEAGVAATLARALPEEIPLLVTTVTPTGQERARALLGHRAQVTYLPFELGFSVQRFFRRFQPSGLILTEGDYWPLVLRAATHSGIPVAVVSGRVSDRSFARLRRLRRWLGPLFGPVQHFGMQTEEDRRRLLELGVPAERVANTGNLKFEIGAPPPRPELEEAVRRLGGDRPVLVAGSTMRGEDPTVLDAFEQLGGGDRALLVLAPRHPERWDEVASLLAGRRLAFRRRSRPEAEGTRCDVLLLDTLGELAALYRIAKGVFIGGTLVPTGGHNPLEAAVFAAPIAVGPSMDNFREISEHFDRADAWRRVADAGELAAVWREWLVATPPEGERALELVERHRGALPRTLEMLGPLLAAVGGR